MARLFYVVLGVGILLSLLSMYLIFFYAPVEQTMGIVQKIFYPHVSAAMTAYAGFIVCSVASFFYLLRPSKGWDIAARAGVEVGLIFCAYVLISGPIWAYKAWGKAWVKEDPQLNATLILFLMYGGYFLLRLFSGNAENMRKVAAVLGVLACINIPIVHYAVRYWGGMHPTVEREGGGGLAPDIALTLRITMLSFLLLFVAILWLQVRIKRREARVHELFVDIEDVTRSRA